MFQLAEIRHMVRIPPWLFGQTLNDAVVEELNRKLANKVVLNVGLCIALFDVTSLGDSYIFPGDGASHTRATFRYVVFRPFMEEILEGVIKSADADGMQVSLGFYDDVYIRRDSMMTNSHYDETDRTWVWDYQTDDDTHHLFMDIAGPNLIEGDVVADRKEGKIPYIVYGAINDQGLGLVSWWTSSIGGGDNEGEEEEEELEEAV
ncbi:DNA-directed RNA polymerase III subunit RPC8-like [Homarus americanus]|uniref:DNA-directed RNA polymerase III subunit RPC8-like n=1 Tax=Homarus americanus TaxID=6706 RepID=A0A8J5JFT9_HOMAM|nr:DNA-directed RNA polymerase III subunit RPC8-like [Homarus americanus]